LAATECVLNSRIL